MAEAKLRGGGLLGRDAVVAVAVMMAGMVLMRAVRYLQEWSSHLVGRGKGDELGLKLSDSAFDLALEVRVFFLYLL
jgi:hypothetical protein